MTRKISTPPTIIASWMSRIAIEICDIACVQRLMPTRNTAVTKANQWAIGGAKFLNAVSCYQTVQQANKMIFEQQYSRLSQIYHTFSLCSVLTESHCTNGDVFQQCGNTCNRTCEHIRRIPVSPNLRHLFFLFFGFAFSIVHPVMSL